MMKVFTEFNDWQKEAVQPYGRLSLKKFASEIRRLATNGLVPVVVLPRTSQGIRLARTGEPPLRVVK